MARSGSTRRRPAEARARLLGRLGGQHAVVGHATGDRPHDVERIEGRHAGTRFRDVEPRIREIQPLGRRADRDLQQQSLGAARGRPGGRARDRCVTRGHRAAADLRGAAAARRARPDRARTRRGRCGRAPDAACRRTSARTGARRIPVEADQAIVQHVARFLDGDRPDFGHRAAVRRASAAPAPGAAAPRTASAGKRSSHSPQIAWSGQSASASMIGSANSRRWARFRRSRSNRAMRADSGSSRSQLGDPVAVVRGQTVEPAPPARACRRRGCGRRPPRTRRSAPPISTAIAACPRRRLHHLNPTAPRSTRARPRRNRRDAARPRLPGPATETPRRVAAVSTRSWSQLPQRGVRSDPRPAAPSSAAPGRARGIRRSAWPTALRTRTTAARRTHVLPDRADECRDRNRRARRLARTHARAGRDTAGARAGTRPSRRTARRAPPRRARGGRSRPLRGLRRVLRTAIRRPSACTPGRTIRREHVASEVGEIGRRRRGIVRASRLLGRQARRHRARRHLPESSPARR